MDNYLLLRELLGYEDVKDRMRSGGDLIHILGPRSSVIEAGIYELDSLGIIFYGDVDQIFHVDFVILRFTPNLKFFSVRVEEVENIFDVDLHELECYLVVEKLIRVLSEVVEDVLEGERNYSGVFFLDFLEQAHRIGFTCSRLAVDDDRPIRAIENAVDCRLTGMLENGFLVSVFIENSVESKLVKVVMGAADQCSLVGFQLNTGPIFQHLVFHHGWSYSDVDFDWVSIIIF